jgi:DNA repair exonuclease SbcCD ATPase subunit
VAEGIVDMINLKFEYVRAENFLCFNEIERDLVKFGNVILVRGIDLDRCSPKLADQWLKGTLDAEDEQELRKASNGVGKSAIAEIIVYALYGKTIKEKLGHEDVIHNKVGKKLRVEVVFGNYKVVRTRKPNGLRFWESANHVWDNTTEITLGGMPATQQLIEDKIGLSYQTFVNTVVFTDNNNGSFLECDTPTKREIVENLLSLSAYRQYSENAKGKRNEFKDVISSMAKDFQILLTELDANKKRVEKILQQQTEWVKQKKEEYSRIEGMIVNKKAQLTKTDSGAALAQYNEAQDKLKKLVELLPSLQEKLAKVKSITGEVENKLSELKAEKNSVFLGWQTTSSQIKALNKAVADSKIVINSFEEKNGTVCPSCLGKVSENNFSGVVKAERQKIVESEAKCKLLTAEQTQASEKLAEVQKNIERLVNTLSIAEQKNKETQQQITSTQRETSELMKVKKPEVGTDEKVIEGQIEELKLQLANKQLEIDGPTPYVEILKNSNEEVEQKSQECQLKKFELDEAEKELPYYEFWVRAFGDSGIRKFVIEGIIPALNSRVAHWLQFLIDGKIKLNFNNELEPTIERNPSDGDPFVYYAMSGGERRRLNLAVSQAFAYIMMINSGASASLVFLDEVTTNIDPAGVEGVYNMIQELAKTRQVFVTTHDRDLQEMLLGAETINLVKKDGFTTLNS